MVGRVKTYEAIVKNENIPEPGIPESFKVLIKEMQSLGLDVKVLSDDNQEIEILDSSDYDTVGSIDQIMSREPADDMDDIYEEPLDELDETEEDEPEDAEEDFDETLDLDEEFNDEF